MRIDGHHHLWDPAQVEYQWLGPELAPINRAFTAVELEQHLAEHDIQATVIVQAANSREDTAFLLREADACAWIAAVVGWVDLDDPAAVRAAIDPAARHPKLRGVRHLLDEEPLTWVRDERRLVALEAIADAGLVLEIPALFPWHLPAIPDLARRLEHLTIVIDHLGSPRPGREAFAEWTSQLAAAAVLPNAHAKLSGLRTVFTGAEHRARAVTPYVQHALDVFGAERLLWGSDWPVCLLAESYASSWELVDEALSGCSEAERDLIFGGTAANLYGIGMATRAQPEDALANG